MDVDETMKYLKNLQRNPKEFGDRIIFVLDTGFASDFLSTEEKNKLQHVMFINPEQPRILEKGIPHGTTIIKLVCATSSPDTKVHFIDVGDGVKTVHFDKVAKAFEYIINFGRFDSLSINCSFSVSGCTDP